VRRVRWWLWVASCVVLGAPATALAQGAPPAGAPVVAGPLADGTALVAFDRGDRICVSLRGGEDAACNPPPESALNAAVEWEWRRDRSLAYGTVTADVATVEVIAPGHAETVPAGAGAYAGHFAGRVHFFLAAIAGRPYRVRLLDAQGRVVGASDLDKAPAIGASATLTRGHVGGRTWRAMASRHSMVAPTPLDLGRTETMTCIDVTLGAFETMGGTCAGPSAPPDGLALFANPHCRPEALVIGGLAGPAVSRIDAVLGDGSRRRATLADLPGRFGDPRRAFVLVVGADVAVRSLLIRTDGRTRATRLAIAPGGATCGLLNLLTTWGFVFGPSHHESRGGGPLVAHDQGDDLCVGLGTIAAADCQLPPVEPSVSRIERRVAGADTTVLAVTPPAVAALRLHFDRGPAVTVPTADLPGYTGQYQGFVRAVAFTVAGDRRLYSVQLLAADGRVLGTRPGPDPRPLAHTPRVLARLPGGLVVSATRDCVQMRPGAPTRDPQDCEPQLGAGGVTTPCAARRTVVILRTKEDLTVTTDRGTVRGRRSGAYVVAVVPARFAVRAIRLAGARSMLLRLPPASRQCGYVTPMPAIVNG
jgi:hypothetical protein